MQEALITNIQGYSIHDGAGIRTLVFFKGCGLACRWCCNPENISPALEVGFNITLCKGCGKCAAGCPNGAITIEDGQLPQRDHQLCTSCGQCVAACTNNALTLYGNKMSVQEVFEAVSRDSMFYQASGGGVTVSGGEPLLKPQFVLALLERCHLARIHTCIETSGFAATEAVKQVLPATDYVLFDLKHMDSDEHRKLTGQPNGLVLENAESVAASGTEMLFRMPLIPGLNDTPQNIEETAAFIRSLEKNRLELMPYHRLGESKYAALGKEYRMRGIMPPETDYVETLRKAFEEKGLICTVSR